MPDGIGDLRFESPTARRRRERGLRRRSLASLACAHAA
jgi:hypothetical protein